MQTLASSLQDGKGSQHVRQGDITTKGMRNNPMPRGKERLVMDPRHAGRMGGID